jgi:hypothetical protein
MSLDSFYKYKRCSFYPNSGLANIKGADMTIRAKKAGLSFAESRKKLLNNLKAGTDDAIVEKKVNFRNDDVPTFLKRLKEFEKKSRSAVLTVK